jgi:monofunctional biosynthetic peptidoglycan transglycosylase
MEPPASHQPATGGTARAAARRRRSLPSRLARLAGLFALVGLGLLALAAVAPMPSTLMLARQITGAPVERQWQPLARISPHLVAAVIAAEDQQFCSHRGVDWGALREVASDPDGPQRGASTITMQTVKNLYLWHGSGLVAYARKGLEIPLALAADLVWSKPRTLELYLNVAEWGPGLFGAEAAARRYFRKSAADLTRAEAARLAAALPNPALRAPDRSSVRAAANARRTLTRMQGLGDRAACVAR